MITKYKIGSVVEAKDAYTCGHLWRVSQFAKLIGKKIVFSKEQKIAFLINAKIKYTNYDLNLNER